MKCVFDENWTHETHEPTNPPDGPKPQRIQKNDKINHWLQLITPPC